MMGGANVQIPLALFEGMGHLLDALRGPSGDSMDKPTQILAEALRNEIRAKCEALERRKAFTAYKTAEKGTQEREDARKSFLDQSGVHKDWRTSGEISSSP